MNRIKTILKNNLPIVALLLAFTLVFTQSAFKSSRVESEWGLYTGSTIPGGPVNGQWYEYSATPPAGYEFVCEGTSEICTSVYEGNPNTSGTFIEDGSRAGEFDVVLINP